MNELIALDHLRLLSLVLLLPILVRGLGPQESTEEGVPKRFEAAGILLLLYALLQVLLFFPYQSATASLRRVVELCLDVLLPYFIVSRGCRNRESMVEAMACFVLALIVLASLAWVEFSKGWLLYAGIQDRWGTAHIIGYLTRVREGRRLSWEFCPAQWPQSTR